VGGAEVHIQGPIKHERLDCIGARHANAHQGQSWHACCYERLSLKWHMAKHGSLLYAAAGAGALIWSSSALSQIAAPSQVTPQTLRPAPRPNEQALRLPGPSETTLPAGNAGMTVVVGKIDLEGAFPELRPLTDAVVARAERQRLTVAQIYAVAAALERIYAAAGYPLVRISVPPQALVDGGDLRLVVTDGFIEAIDVSALPERVRKVVADRTNALLERPHLKLEQIERALLIAGQVPGVNLRSTLVRGTRTGGVRLVLDGEHRLLSGSIGADDLLPRSLGTWQLRGTLAVNSAFGAGEQIYVTAGLGANLRAALDGNAPVAVSGGGGVVPIGTDGITANPEYTHSRTATRQTGGVPASLGTFDRLAVRLRGPIGLSRNKSLYATAALEDIDQQISAPDFATTLNHDHYHVLRGGLDYAALTSWGVGLQLGLQLSKGLGGRTAQDAITSGVPLSRQGAAPDFFKLAANARLSQPLPAGYRFDLIGAGQFTNGRPMLRSEQMSLDTGEALSAFASGTLNADEALTLRGELAHPFALPMFGTSAAASPYLFAAGGRGWLANATSVEQAAFNAAAVGSGVRSNIGLPASEANASLAVEVARAFTDLNGLRQGWRANVVGAVTF